MLSLLLLPLLLTPTILAADCFGGSGLLPTVEHAWRLREQVCIQGACSAAGADQHFCRIVLPFAEGGAVEIQRSDPAGRFVNCLDATENIITQCFNNPSGPGITDSASPNGNWRLGEEWYWVTMHRDYSAVQQQRVDHDVIFGPSQYCQGLSRGMGAGGDSCVDIPEGCYIHVPTGNTVPEVQCRLPDVSGD